MNPLYSKAFTMLLTIALGYFLRLKGVFTKKDADVISRIMLNITLPAMIISYLNGLELNSDIAYAVLAGLVVNFLFFLCGFIGSRKDDPDDRTARVFSTSCLNIGGFGIPILSTVATPAAIAAIMAFNYVGTPIFQFGIAPAVCSASYSGKSRLRLSVVLSKLFRNVCGATCFAMLGLAVLHIRLPQPLIAFCGSLNQANNVLAMLIVGILLEVRIPIKQLKNDLGIVFLRLAAAVACSLLIFFFLPVADDIRRALTLVVYVPVSTTNAAVAIACGYKGSRVAINSSLYLLISIAAISVLLLFLY